MKLDPLLQPLAELAPEWARYAVFEYDGELCWQERLGAGKTWLGSGEIKYPQPNVFVPEIRLTAIHLPTGTVHLQQPDSTIVEVPQSEWSGMP